MEFGEVSDGEWILSSLFFLLGLGLVGLGLMMGWS